MAGISVYLPGLGKTAKTGKGFFYQRLAKALADLGLNVIKSPDSPHDISLHSAKLAKTNGKKHLLRLDGVYHNSGQPYKKMNNPIRKSLRKADGVIYQSKYAKKLCNNYLGKKKPHVVIHNGMSLDYWEKVEPIPTSHKNIFIAASRWRPHKRLIDIIECFKIAKVPESVLFIAGDLKKSGIPKSRRSKLFGENIVYLGTLTQPELHRYFKAACASVHLCWFDACPNSVIESICCGTPVICNNTGGTPEIVSISGGYICDIDQPYDFKPVDLYHPPTINRQLVAENMQKAAYNSISIENAYFDIKNIAQKYSEFFERIMKG